MAALTLALLGPPQITRADGTAVVRARKELALLAYLAVERRHPHSRDTLLGMFWPESPEEAARNSLRVALANLRAALGEAAEPYLLTGRHSVQFSTTSDHMLDVAAFVGLLAEHRAHCHEDGAQCAECAARLTQAIALYRGDFLSGFALPDSTSFEEWVLVVREQLHQQAIEALDMLAAYHEQQGDYAALARDARRQIELEPWREQALRQLMRALAAMGDRVAALAAYERCRRVLEAELGVEPDEETLALYEQILTGELVHKETRRQGDKESKGRVSLSPPLTVSWSPHLDRSEAPEPGHVYGREQEVAQVRRWLLEERCQLVGVFGIGGVGKTALAATVIQAVGGQFGRVIWRSLLNAPPLEELLRLVLPALAAHTMFERPISLEEQLALLLECLRQQRCLLILDNLESVLHAGGLGQMRAGYEGYAQLLDRLAHSKHQSCVLLTSRERPQGLARWEADLPWVRTLRLEGLDAAAGQAMLNARGLTDQEEDARVLIARYSGNPLALKLVAQTVHELFGGAITDFLREETPIFDDIRAVLDQQYARLSELEQEILVWLAIEREAIAAARLRANLVQAAAPQIFLGALRALQRRSLLEKTESAFTLQNVVMEYVTEHLVEGVYAELTAGLDTVTRWQGDKVKDGRPVTSPPGHPLSVSMLNRFALLKAQAKEYVRQSQVRLIVQPIASRLAAKLGPAALVERLTHILTSLQGEAHGQAAPVPGYAAGNILNLLLHAGVDVSRYDFSHLCVWQAYLRGMYLPQLNLAGADLAGSVFTHMFGDIQELRFRADGELLVVGLGDGLLRLWRAEDGELVHAVPLPDSSWEFARLRPDSPIAALVRADYSIVIMDIPSSRVLHQLSGHQSMIWRLSFSPDGRRAASSDTSGQVCVWEIEDGRLPHRFQLHANPITALAFTPDGEKLAGGAVDGTVYLWDLATGELIHTFQGHTEEVAVLMFARGGAVVATGSHDHTVRLWDAASGAAIHVLRGHTQPIRCMASDLAGRILATGGGDTFIALWDVESGELLHPLADHRSPILQLACSPDGQLVAASDFNETISIWDVPGGQRRDFYPMHHSAIHAVAFSLDGQRMLSGGADWAVYVWDVSAPASAHVSARLPGHRHRIKTIAISADGMTAASGDFSGGLLVWDIRSRTHRALEGQQGTIMALAFSPDGRTLASAGADGTIRLWDVQTGQPSLVLRGHTNVVRACVFSPDGRTLASGSMDRTVCLWDTATGDLLSTMGGHTNIVHVVIFSPDGRRLISTSYDQTVRLWDPHTSQLMASWPAQHTVYVACAVHPDGDVLAAGGADHIVRLLETATGRVLRELHGHGHTVESLSFHPAGGLLASASKDETIKLWDITSKGTPLEADASLATLRSPGPYAGMNIAGVTGISDAQKAALKVLGALEGAALANEALGAEERPAAPDHLSPAPSASPLAPTHNLPSPLSSFVGREDELAHLAALLAGDTRLVTLIGAGGVGKTRLALAIAWRLLPQFADGAWWVALAGVQPADDPALQRATLASVVATALGRTLGGRRDPLDELADALHDRAALLVLDNCEHLPELPAVARALLELAPEVRIVATSREPLGLSSEALVRLEGLLVPLPGAADPASYPGVQLFLERAARHTSGWGQDRATIAATARLCRLLEGLPLGIELAAHWVGHYTPDEIAEAIQADLDFLAVRTRDVPDRHRSLRAVFDYAWHLLSAAEQRALARISVFRGSFDRAAAQAVAEVLATTLVTLVDKSLLRQAGVGYYSLHELLRQFAAERLLASGEVAAMRAQHAVYYLALVEQAIPELAGPDEAAWLERLDRALDNLRAALSWAQERGQTELGLRLAGALERFWFTRGYLGEGREWLERFLTRASELEMPPAVRAQAFSAAGLLANTQGDHSQAIRLLEQGLACYREGDDHAGAVRALTTLGGVAYDQGDLRGAQERWEQSLAQARAMGDLGEVARALGNLGEAHYHLGDLERAEALHTEALALARQVGRANLEAFQLGDLGNVARRQGDLARATALHRQALDLKRALGARRQIAITLEDLASVAAAEGHETRAACLLGAATTIREAIGTPQAIPERIATEQAVAGARAALGEDAWAAAFMAGVALSLDQAIAYALE